ANRLAERKSSALERYGDEWPTDWVDSGERSKSGLYSSRNSLSYIESSSGASLVDNDQAGGFSGEPW
ncbi:hypothetical protein RSAG8_00990, partial [Rhizoctonia solani AG-8 WAC10335]